MWQIISWPLSVWWLVFSVRPGLRIAFIHLSPDVSSVPSFQLTFFRNCSCYLFGCFETSSCIITLYNWEMYLKYQQMIPYFCWIINGSYVCDINLHDICVTVASLEDDTWPLLPHLGSFSSNFSVLWTLSKGYWVEKLGGKINLWQRWSELTQL